MSLHEGGVGPRLLDPLVVQLWRWMRRVNASKLLISCSNSL